jgi:hypothetical protein
VDADTGRPVQYFMVTSDPPGRFGSIGNDTGVGQAGQTDAEGKARIAVAPGKRRIGVDRHDIVKGPPQPVDLPAGGEVKLRFELRKKGQPAAPPAAAAPKPPTCTVTVGGTATRPDGKPVAGANVVLCYANYSASKLLAQTTTDASGRYEFRDANMAVDWTDQDTSVHLQVGATAPGLTVAWSPVMLVPARRDAKFADLPNQRRLIADPTTLDLTFDAPSPLQGRIVDERGQPLPGVAVVLDFVDNFRTIGRGENSSFVTLDFVVPAKERQTTTDRDGRFRLAVARGGASPG